VRVSAPEESTLRVLLGSRVGEAARGVWLHVLSLSGEKQTRRTKDVRVKLTSVCCKSMLAKGLRAGAWLAAVPFASFTGLSGGGVAS
jgi:hypothetical protein